jgi:hypothetical protein
MRVEPDWDGSGASRGRPARLRCVSCDTGAAQVRVEQTISTFVKLRRFTKMGSPRDLCSKRFSSFEP